MGSYRLGATRQAKKKIQKCYVCNKEISGRGKPSKGNVCVARMTPWACSPLPTKRKEKRRTEKNFKLRLALPTHICTSPPYAHSYKFKKILKRGPNIHEHTKDGKQRGKIYFTGKFDTV